ncbi:MAG: ABC transporter substrate-binding protein [Veillonella sp.]|uniref:ABC transporter substrate-binding protein n=1 Tax=Veillonella sp. TaxID=1926307 RepID=UPI0025EE7BFD|nr:ABC transporter substrate-binding protein [Veillonella sp.]MBS4913362.1 ABC transporter substrate-binding protein [Veillonella sp.]
MKNWSLCALLVLVLFVSAGCGVAASDWQIASPLKSKAVHKPLFDVNVPRADTSEAIDAELAARYKQVKKDADKLFTVENGKTILKHKYGTTVLPDNPQRVVVIRLEDPMVALGAPMVGAYNTPTFYLHDELVKQGVATISINEDTKAINLEQVQALKPDLILLRDSFDRNTYDALSKIAPVAALNLQQTESTLLAMGRILHREKDAEARLALYYSRVKEARMEIKSIIGDEPVALIRVLKKEVRLYPYDSNPISRFMYELLNIRPDALAISQNGSDTSVISLEMLPEIKAEYLIVSSGYGPSSAGNNEAAEKRYAELREDPLWQIIPAVRDNHVFNVDPIRWNAHGIIAKEMAIEDLRRYFIKQP